MPSHIYADNGTYNTRLVVTDPYGAADTAYSAVTVDNAPPVITSLVTPVSAGRAGAAVTLGLTFTDPGTADTHTITVDWGDGVTSAGTTHAYASAGLYFVTATVRDDDGGSDTRTAGNFIVIFDPNKERVLSAKTHHMNCDYSLFEGMKIKGYPETVLSRGKVIIENNEYKGHPGEGQFIRRGACAQL